jgi:O-antigen/teichoic acid export membrane protein
VVHKVGRLGALLATFVGLGLLALAPWLYTELFDSNSFMVAALIVAVLAYAPAHIARGICSGTGRFKAYGVVLGADGVMRIAFCLLLAAFGVEAVGAYGFAVALAPLVGVAAVAWKRQLVTQPGPDASWTEVTPNLGWLLLGSLMAALLVNAGPLALAFLADPEQDADVTRFGYGVILARIPLFMFQAVQAALLPRLARLAATERMVEFRRGFRRLMLLILVVGVVGVAGAWLFGKFAVETLYDSTLGQRTLTVLALGSVFYMVALAAAQAVIALHGHALVAMGWTIGVIVFVASVLLLPSDESWLFKRVELGVLIGSAAAMVSFLVALRVRVRKGLTPDAESVLEAITDIPLEA